METPACVDDDARTRKIMTITAVPSVHHSVSDADVHWKQADHDVFVATVHNEFAGFISVEGAEHTVHTAHSEPIGTYRNLREARAALGQHLTRSKTAAPRPNQHPARRRRWLALGR